MKLLSLSIAALLSAGAASAQSLDCAALANSAFAEPAGYSEQCLNRTPAPAANSINAPTDTAFTIDVRGQAGVPTRPANGLHSFVLNAFQTQTLRGTTQPQVFAMDFDVAGTTLYGVTGSGAAPNPSTLGTINTTTGAFTVIGAVTGLTAGDSASGLAIHPRTGVAYFSAAGGTPATSRLYTLNLATGAATLVGQITAPTDAAGTIMIDISINCEGQLFAHSISDDALYSVNTTTGAGTLIGTHGLAANFAQGMDFDNQDGQLYAFIYTGTGTNRFGTFNLATGAFTTLVQDNPLGEYEGAIPTQCPALGAPIAGVASPTVNFGRQLVGATRTATQTITNTGNAALNVTAITTPTAPFSRTGGTCGTVPFTVAAGASCTIIYTFAPTGTTNTNFQQTITLTTNGGNPTFSLVGQGVVSVQLPASSNPGLLALLALTVGVGLFGLRRR